MRAIRILQANWLNAEVAGDRNAVKLVSDEMARDAVEVHQLAEYAPEYDPVGFVGPEKAAERLEQLKVTEFPATATPVEQIEADLAEMKLPDEREAEPELKQPWSTASKAEWITWAAHGDHGQTPVTEEEAAAMTKIQLMSRYGSRL